MNSLSICMHSPLKSSKYFAQNVYCLHFNSKNNILVSSIQIEFLTDVVDVVHFHINICSPMNLLKQQVVVVVGIELKRFYYIEIHPSTRINIFIQSVILFALNAMY